MSFNLTYTETGKDYLPGTALLPPPQLAVTSVPNPCFLSLCLEAHCPGLKPSVLHKNDELEGSFVVVVLFCFSSVNQKCAFHSP